MFRCSSINKLNSVLSILIGASSSPSTWPAIRGTSHIKGPAWGSRRSGLEKCSGLSRPSIAGKAQVGKGHQGHGWQASSREITLFLAWCSLAAQGEGDGLTPLATGFLENLGWCHPFLSSLLPSSPLGPSRTSLFCVQLMDWFCFLVGLSKAVPILPCMHHSPPPPSPWHPLSVTLCCDANQVTWLPLTQNGTYKCLGKEQPEMDKMWLLPPWSLQPERRRETIYKWNTQGDEPDKV